MKPQNPENDHYTSPQAAQVLGMPLRKFLAFVERGYVTPSVQDAQGHGTKRLWSFLDLVRCAAVDILLKATSVDAVRKLAVPLADDRNVQWNSWWLLPMDNLEKPQVLEWSGGGPAEYGAAPEPPWVSMSIDDAPDCPICITLDFHRIHSLVHDRLGAW